MKFNVLVVCLMEFVNIMCKMIDGFCGVGDFVVCEVVEMIVVMFDLIVLYIVEEMWEFFGYEFFVGLVIWCFVDLVLLVEDMVMVVV